MCTINGMTFRAPPSMFVALGIQHALRMCHTVIYGLSGSTIVVVVTPSSLRRLLVILYQDFLGNF